MIGTDVLEKQTEKRQYNLMGLTIVINGVGSDHCYVDGHRTAPLFELADEYSLATPHCEGLLSGDLDTQLQSPGEVAELREELILLAETRREQLAREKGVSARDAEVRDQIVERLVGDDQVLLLIGELMSLCEAALDADTGLMGLGE